MAGSSSKPPAPRKASARKTGATSASAARVATPRVSAAPKATVTPAVVADAPAADVDTSPTPAPGSEPVTKEDQMNAETITKNVERATETVEKATKDAMAHGQAAFDQMNEKAGEVMEHAAKSVGEMTEFTKGNMEAMIASAKAATTGAEVLAKELAEQAKARFEATSNAWKVMMAAKTPNELFQYQNDFMKSQMDASIAAMSQMTETMLKVAGDVTQPLSNRVALAAEQMKKTLEQR
jgi:phasin family protein